MSRSWRRVLQMDGAMSKPIIYLAGPVRNLEDGGAGWRVAIEERYGEQYDFRNPLDKYNVPAEDLTVVSGRSDPEDESTVGTTEIVEGDKELLRESDAVLVGHHDVQQIGTPMEVMWAYDRGYPIALVSYDVIDMADLSPWYREHVGYESFFEKDALIFLEREFSNRRSEQ